MQIYLVGGAVRDELLGVTSKDQDFTVVLEDSDLQNPALSVTHFEPFEIMVINLEKMGFKIFKESPEFLTARAQFPEGTGDFAIDNLAGGPAKPGSKRLTADFVLARKESDYTDGRRPDTVVPGTLMDDLKRRDFGMNAIAKDSEGNLIDPFNGVQDINDRVIRAVGSAFERLTEDALRAVRALRFSVTKGFRIDHELVFAMETAAVLDSIRRSIPDERIREELDKMFAFDTLASLAVLQRFPLLTDAMFAGSVNLMPTMKQRRQR